MARLPACLQFTVPDMCPCMLNSLLALSDDLVETCTPLPRRCQIRRPRARVLAVHGAHVVMTAWNLAAAYTVRKAVVAETPAANLDVMELDLSSMASIHKFAAYFDAKGLPLNILVNNAGVMAKHYTLSKDGIGMQLVTNHVVCWDMVC